MSLRLAALSGCGTILKRTVWGEPARRLRSICAMAVKESEEIAQADELSNVKLFHRSVDFALRAGPKREKKEIRKKGNWIPSVIQGCGKIPDLLISVPLAPFLRDFEDRLFANSKDVKLKWWGPLYELRPLPPPDTSELEEDLQLLQSVPFKRIRVKAVNMELNAMTEVPKSIGFVYAPEEEPVRVRIPVKFINQEKCPGLKDGGYLNRVMQNVDVNVAPFVRAPLIAVQDVGGLKITNGRTVGDLAFEGKGKGCRTVLDDDVVTTIISKI